MLNTHLKLYHHHGLKSSHPLHNMHHLIEHTNENQNDGHDCKLVPQVVGMSIPRETSALWPLFVLT